MGSGSNWAYTSTGGSGAGYDAKIVIRQNTTVDVTVGKAGYGRAGQRGEGAVGGNAEPTIVKFNNNTVITAGGGTRAGYGYAGSGGQLTVDPSLEKTQVILAKNGPGGGTGYTWCGGVGGPISGHTWGRSGNASGGWAGGGVDSSFHGYIKIIYLGPLDES